MLTLNYDDRRMPSIGPQGRCNRRINRIAILTFVRRLSRYTTKYTISAEDSILAVNNSP